MEYYNTFSQITLCYSTACIDHKQPTLYVGICSSAIVSGVYHDKCYILQFVW